MKRISNKGFTLIELLAVITIMGILMLVAIPAVTRTIENSRRDTFSDVANEYLTAVRNAVLADEIECAYAASGTDWTVASALPDGTYYFPICTNKGDTTCTDIGDGTTKMTKEDIQNSTTDLLESGGKSPFGNADVYGYVTWTKASKDANTTQDGNDTEKKSTTVYKVIIQDTGKHGLNKEQKAKDLKRSVVLPEISDAAPSKILSEKITKDYCRMA